MAVDKTVNQQSQDSSPTTDDFILTWDTGSGASKKVAISDILLLSNPYKFSAYLAANQTGIGDAAITKVLLDSELFDTGNNFDAATNHRFVAPINGFYQVNVFASLLSPSNSGVASIVFIYKNGSSIRRSDFYPTVGVGAGVYHRGNISGLLQLTAGDYLEVYIYLDVSSSTVTVQGTSQYTAFDGYLVSKA